MSKLPASENRTSKAKRIIASNGNPYLEVGSDQHGFIVGLPRSRGKYDSIWVIVDRLTKAAHFLPVRTAYSAEDYVRLYLKEIVRLHGIPISIITDRGAQFTAKFWMSFQEGLGTQVKLSTTFHL